MTQFNDWQSRGRQPLLMFLNTELARDYKSLIFLISRQRGDLMIRWQPARLVCWYSTFSWDRQGLTSFFWSLFCWWKRTAGEQCRLLCCTVASSVRFLTALTFHLKVSTDIRGRIPDNFLAERGIWLVAGHSSICITHCSCMACFKHDSSSLRRPKTLLSMSSLNPCSISQRKLK